MKTFKGLIALCATLAALLVTPAAVGIVIDPAPPDEVYVPLGGQLTFKWTLDRGERAVHVLIARPDARGDSGDWARPGRVVFESGPFSTGRATVTFARRKWRTGAFFWDLCVVHTDLEPGHKCGMVQRERSFILYDPTVRPRLSTRSFWLDGRGRPGPIYVNASLSVCNQPKPEPVTLLVSERKTIGDRTVARKNWSRGVGTVYGCEGRTLRWKLGKRFDGIGSYTVTIRARSSRGLLSNTLQKSWVTSR